MSLKAMLTVFIFTLFLCQNISGQTSRIPVVGFNEFEKNLNSISDTVYVINFWATWCAPCRKELPGFEKIHTDFSQSKVKVLLVSLDFIKNADTTLKNYLSSNGITAQVILLNEPDANSWIDKVSPAWSGALPATLIYRGEKRLFFEKILTYEDIKSSIISLNNL